MSPDPYWEGDRRKLREAAHTARKKGHEEIARFLEDCGCVECPVCDGRGKMSKIERENLDWGFYRF